MLRFRSLRTRVIVFTTIPLITILVATLLVMINTAHRTVQENVHQSLREAGSVFVQLLQTRQNELVTMTQVTARDPRFFATFSIPLSDRGPEFRPTLEGVTLDFLRITDADFLEVFDAMGNAITCVQRRGTCPPIDPRAGLAGLQRAVQGSPAIDTYHDEKSVVIAAVAPVFVANHLEAIVRLGSYVDDAFVGEVHRLTGADVCVAVAGNAYASTFDITGPSQHQWHTSGNPGISAAHGAVTLSEDFVLDVDGEDYLTTHVRVAGADNHLGFDGYIGRQMRAEFAPLASLQRTVALGGLLAVLVTLFAGFFIARSITGPLSNIVLASSALRRGEYDYPLTVSGRDEVAKLARNFGEMRESLKTYVEHLRNLDQAKSNFITLASHELRTPLTVISGFNDMISSGGLGEVPEKVQETTAIINEQLTDLNALVQSMLDLTYFEQGLHTFDLRPVDLRDVVRAALDTRRDAIARRDLDLVEQFSSAPVPARADRERIGDAVGRIVDNAIRFTPDGGVITVGVHATDGEARVSVKDTGMGIPPNELKWIFEKIYEVGDVLHHQSGTHGFGTRGFGLGLALCKAIVDNHDGRIDVDSAPGRGSRFTIALKLDAKRDETPRQTPSKEPEGALT